MHHEIGGHDETSIGGTHHRGIVARPEESGCRARKPGKDALQRCQLADGAEGVSSPPYDELGDQPVAENVDALTRIRPAGFAHVTHGSLTACSGCPT